LRRELHASDAPQQTRALIADYLTDARHAAADADLPIELAAGLAALLDCLRTSYFVTV
jgi:hypothetical protein